MNRKLSECEKGYRRWISPKARDPRIDPQAGDRLCKLVTDRRGVSRVTSRFVKFVFPHSGTVTYTPRRVLHTCTLAEWRKWAKGAKPPQWGYIQFKSKL